MPQARSVATRLWLVPTITAAVLAAGFCWLAVYIRGGQGGPTALDNRIITAVRAWESPGMTSFMKCITGMGNGLPVVVLSIVLLLVLAMLRYRLELLLFIAVVSGSGLLNLLLKQLVQRTRPAGERLVEAAGYSFPSGHAMAAFTLYGITAYLIWKHIPRREGRALMALISVLLIFAIGLSRIYVGVHYPTDVLGAYLASGTWLAVTVGAFRCWQAARQPAKRQ
ncbi:phosphatase PAP2 family protein [Paenibacillus kobensis]|uniref:phosphatase PAP2 family protein n=1 Tax=Paenibacillus kobensis TaxID=59841 RepID=UPI000FD9BC63|nr:phosphatase PAP2 family protein [Paenibacillus kobensis]